MFKKIVSILLVFTFALGLIACSQEYPPQESSEEEARVVFSFSIEGERYDVRYELYRALFLTHRAEVDGGDASVWQGANKESYVKQIDEIIIDYAADIYTALHLAKKIGYNPYSAEADEAVSEFISQSVNGYVGEDYSIEGFDGDYEAYLASLKEMNLNYSVQDLLCRYSLAQSAINGYYAGSVDDTNPTPDMEEGKLEYTADDVREFYNGEDSVRVLVVTLSSVSNGATLESATKIRNKIAEMNDLTRIQSYVMSLTISNDSDIMQGVMIGKHSLDRAYYGEVIDAAFALRCGEVSEVISIETQEASEFWILCKVDKTDSYFNDNYEDIENVYVSNEIGKIINDTKQSVTGSVQKTDFLASLNRADIKMP